MVQFIAGGGVVGIAVNFIAGGGIVVYWFIHRWWRCRGIVVHFIDGRGVVV